MSTATANGTGTGADTSTGNEALAQRWQGALMNTYGVPRLPLVRGAGARFWDADGNEYVDFLGGIATNALGTAHPAIVEAVTRQIGSLAHVSNLFFAEPTVALAERLLALLSPAAGAGQEPARPGRVFFSNSGAEANEAAFKISRLTGRTHVVAAQNAFHGRTMGSLALTGQPGKRTAFEPLPGEVTHVPFGDVEALRAAVTTETAAVVLEPIQGEYGVVVPPDGYLAAAREITAATGTLLVLDEVQTGVGRTGEWFACLAQGVQPDVITLAKGLGGGLPIGATIAFGQAADLVTPGSHGTTFGGNPVACAAALAVLDTIAADGLLEHVTRQGEKLREGVAALRHPLVDHVRGAGLLIGIVLSEPLSRQVEQAAQQAGFLVNAAVPGVVRLAPPLVITDAETDAFLRALPGVLDKAYEEHLAAQAAGRPGE